MNGDGRGPSGPRGPSGAVPVSAGQIALSSMVAGLGTDSSPAVLCRTGGTWDSHGDIAAEIRGLAAALSGYGLRAGVAAAVLGPEGYGTLRADLAVIAAGATLVPLDPGISNDTLRRVLASTSAVHAVASDERQLARILGLRPELPALELVLLMSAAPSERKPAALLVETAIQVGAAALSDDPELLRRPVAATDNAMACRIVDAAGETHPVTQAGLLSMVGIFAKTLDVRRGKALHVVLPLGGVERIGAALAALSRGATLLLPDPAQRPDAGLNEHAVDTLLLDVSALERLHRAWIEDIESKSWLGRATIRWSLRHGGEAQARGWKHQVAERVSLRGLRGKLGGRVTSLDVIASAQRARPEVDAFFSSSGLPPRYFYPDPAHAGPMIASS